MDKTKYEITIEIFNGEQCTPESIYLLSIIPDCLEIYSLFE